MQIHPGIFKTYDIRGVVPRTLDDAVAWAIGRAFGALAVDKGESSVAVGRDGRSSGPSLAAALIRGLLESGVDVIDIGMATTPMLYFAASTLTRSGIQVTASHNPKDHNGFKLVVSERSNSEAQFQSVLRAMGGVP
jgi:phosphomannomutase